MIEFPDAKKIAAMLAAIGEPTRLRILFRLAVSPQNVGELAKAIGIPMVNMSHHLGVMRQSGLLEDEKEGRRVIYKFRPGMFTPSTNGDGDEAYGHLNIGSYRVTLLRNGKLKKPRGGKGPSSTDAG
jgi:DNA-binding transcriptional ArsR family regulator